MKKRILLVEKIIINRVAELISSKQGSYLKGRRIF
tara:strand:+ start:2765 stop:2869 length:105 start_codon:yes stop_codon:yes gene_type:complete